MYCAISFNRYNINTIYSILYHILPLPQKIILFPKARSFYYKLYSTFINNYKCMKKLLLSIVIVVNAENVTAQVPKDLQTPCATTAQGTVGNFVISYTIGEMVLVNSFKNNGLFITNGIYQPILPTNPLDGQVFLDGEITVFPNPTPNVLSIQYNIQQIGKMTAQLFDATGKRIIVDEIAVNSFSTKKYDISKYADGMYVLVLQYTSNDGATIKKGKYKIMKMPKG